MKLLQLYEKIGKQPLKVTRNLDVIIKSGDEEFIITNVNYNSGKFDSLQAVKICCETCKNCPTYNKGYPPSHTCDTCTSLDSDMYEMWELKK